LRKPGATTRRSAFEGYSIHPNELALRTVRRKRELNLAFACGRSTARRFAQSFAAHDDENPGAAEIAGRGLTKIYFYDIL